MFSPYFDQEEPQVEISGMIADLDKSPEWELDAIAVFKGKQGYLVVSVSGCSCWPDRGGTSQHICANKTQVQKALREWNEYYCHELLDKLQNAQWKVTQKE